MGNSKNILIVGAGSIGKRHLQNLKILGWKKITLLRRKPDPEMEEAYSVRVITNYAELDEVPYAVIACNPTSLHLDPLRYASETGTHLFMEKPLIHTEFGLAEAEKLLNDFNATFLIGYMLRFHPAIKMISWITKQSIEGNGVVLQHLMERLKQHDLKSTRKDGFNNSKIQSYSSSHRKWDIPEQDTSLYLGAPFAARFEFGSYLPGWPYKEYKKSYAARTDLGGGVINTISHELDLICNFFGIPNKISATALNFGKLGIDAEEMCEALFIYPDLAVSLHLDYLQKEYDRRIRILFENGTLEWNWTSETIHLKPTSGEEITLYVPMGDLNNLYLDEMKYFLKLAENNQTSHSLDSHYTLINTRLLLLMHQSSRTGKKIDV